MVENASPEALDGLATAFQGLLARMADAVASKIDVSGIMRAQSIAISVTDDVRQSSQSVLRNVVGPHHVWRPRSAVLNSDVLKGFEQLQKRMVVLNRDLIRNIDFGLGDISIDLAQAFTKQQTALWKNLEVARWQIRQVFYPPNLRDIDDLDFDEVQAVVRLDGIALYGIPRSTIARSILNADTAAKKRDILGRKHREIAADCRVVAARVTSTRFIAYATMLTMALDALDAGHVAASQALTSNILDSLIYERWGKKKQKDWFGLLPDRSGKRADGVEMTLHEYLATAPLAQAFQCFDRAAKNTTPRSTYSRHATAHTISARQYSIRNAVQAVMVTTSFLLFLEENEGRATGQ